MSPRTRSKTSRSVSRSPSRAPSDASEPPTDPALAFPPELFIHIFSFLATPADLSLCFLVSKAWNIAANDPTVWTSMVHQLWHGKTYIPQQFRDLLAQGNPKEAYRGSLEDSKRDWLTTEELCSFTWEWRFKAVAGEHFTEDDPWYSSLPPRTRKYHPDGRVSGPYAGPSTRWRFVKSAEGKLGPHGKFFRVWNTPAAVVGRHPGHWGFFAQSCWHLTTAWPMPKRGEDPLMDDENLKVTTESQIYEVLCYNGGIDYRDTEIMNRRGFERACKRAGFNVHEVLRFHDDEDSDEEEEGIEFVVVEDGDQVDEEGDEESGDEDDNSNSDDGLGSDVQSLDEDEVEALLREAGSDAEGSD